MADVVSETAATGDSSPRRPDLQVPIDKVKPNPNQPRRTFRPEDLNDLAASIREKGILQPLIVREIDGGMFEIVAGERRWRAAQQAQLHEVPVLVRAFSDAEVIEVAIIENIQRADLNPIEEALGYSLLMKSYDRTQDKLAKVLGKSRSHIANMVRLLNLPTDVRDLVQDGHLSAGHARALVTANEPSVLAQRIVRNGLSVRETEALIKKAMNPIRPKSPAKRPADKDADIKMLEGDLSATLGMPVVLSHPPGQEAGQITIRYKSLDELDTLCRLLSGS